MSSKFDAAMWQDGKWIYGGAALASANKACPKGWSIVVDRSLTHAPYYEMRKDNLFVTQFTRITDARRAAICVASTV